MRTARFLDPRCGATLLLVLLFFAGTAAGQIGAILPKFDGQDRQVRLLEIEAQYAEGIAIEAEVRAEIGQIRARSLEARPVLFESHSQIQRLLEALGPAPDDRREADEVVAERLRLTEQLETADNNLRINELNIATTERLLALLSERRRSELIDNVTARHPVQFTAPAFAGLKDAAIQSMLSLTKHSNPESTETGISNRVAITTVAYLFVLTFVLIISQGADRLVLSRFKIRTDPNDAQRTGVALLRVIVRVLPAVAILGVAAWWLSAQHEPSVGSLLLVGTLTLGFVLADALTVALIAPRRHDWALINYPAGVAAWVRRIVRALVIVWLFSQLLLNHADGVSAPAETSLLISGTASALMSLLALALSHKGFWVDSSRSWHLFRLALLSIAALSLIALMVGYTPLSTFLIERGLGLLAIAVLFWLTRRCYLVGITVLSNWMSRSEIDTDETSNTSSGVLRFWLGIAIEVSIATAFLIPIALILGWDWGELRSVLDSLLFGIEIGSVTLSLTRIGSAIVTFVAVLVITGLIQRGLDHRISSLGRHDDDSLRSSVRALLGYLGLVFAAVLSLGALGVGLANLALIAGALSVGIGFGLQTVVNNFVSGLILLFERPVRVGDWIITASGEGWVKRIGIRSTEIETFDRSSIIVPNSELIGTTVTNWTRRDRTGRIIVPVGVAYSSDPDRVREILLRCVASHPAVLKFPEPFIYWADFADSSLNFEVRAFIRDISQTIIVRSELRFAIFKAFREEGIEIPFPQRDLHIRSGLPESSPG